MDAPSKVLNKTETTITEYKKEDGLTYSVIIDHAAIPNGINSVPDISVSLCFFELIIIFYKLSLLSVSPLTRIFRNNAFDVFCCVCATS